VNHAICKAAIDLAHSFGSVAVAEGIENLDDFKALRELGCDLGQGFLLSAPVAKVELIELVRRRGVERLEKHQQGAKLADGIL
jgi:EAL domain-containing protein (putative c-di-GMP-specific phosphodiesterase class I)